MNKLITCLLLCVLCLPSMSKAATPLVADLSTYRIDIDSSFTGTRIFLFGARNDNGDIVVVIRGPQKDFIVRKKEPFGGIWINRDRMKFFNVPDFYAIASSKPLSEIEQTALFAQLGIGENTLLAHPAAARNPERYKDFSQAFLNHQYAQRLYTQNPVTLQFMGETLFKATVDFPDDIPPGNYTAEFYLISGGQVVGMQSTPISVVKSGLDAFLYGYAHDHPALYGLSAIILALSIGWFAGRVFEKM